MTELDYNAVLDHLGAGLLIFDEQDKLVLDNAPSRRILGPNLVLIRSEGWSAFSMLVENHPDSETTISELRTKVVRGGETTRFSMLLAGSYMPCWISSYRNPKGQAYTQIVIDNPDWTALTELMRTFRGEARAAINDTKGHAQFIRNLLTNPPARLDKDELGKRSVGMINLISTEMYQLQLLIDLLHRLELIRTGKLAALVESGARKIDLEDFIEDFLEELNEDVLLDPNVDIQEYRQRVVVDMDDSLYVMAPKSALRNLLRDVLRNALMYSEPPTPVKLRVSLVSGGRHVQFDITDQGCGVRPKEMSRVFDPFQRARQPQVMREHGYGLSLHLAKSEVEAMGGRMWFESQEGVGSTFSFKVPAYQKT